MGGVSGDEAEGLMSSSTSAYMISAEYSVGGWGAGTLGGGGPLEFGGGGRGGLVDLGGWGEREVTGGAGGGGREGLLGGGW